MRALSLDPSKVLSVHPAHDDNSTNTDHFDQLTPLFEVAEQSKDDSGTALCLNQKHLKS